ncbi:hypothetical protein scyTo_0004485 [Scyliorhinus torazame]|uniref:Immunoglobulin V-set domain-containing protein n=1 Tax=Scyliorhinus torazame TaxID=75743 RepID=A0A401NSM3_SCYTO|nr:hypothetical protein [Scyliorhinus torazame]
MQIYLISFTLLISQPYPAQGLQPRQSPPAVVVAEGNQTSMNCHEQESTPQSMLWYRQSAGQGLTLVGYISVGGDARYEEKDETRISFGIFQPNMQIYLISLTLLISQPSQGLQPLQSPTTLVVAEGNQASMNCHEQESSPQSMLWYRQSSGQGLALIGYIQYGGQDHYEEKDQTRASWAHAMQQRRGAAEPPGTGLESPAEEFGIAGCNAISPPGVALWESELLISGGEAQYIQGISEGGCDNKII